MRPFSAGHLVLLNRVESGFITGRPVEWEDLAISVFICSQTFEDARAAFLNPDLPAFMRRWYRKLVGPFWNRRKLNLAEKAEQFAAYMEEGSRVPTYITKSGGGSIGDVPGVQVVKALLMSRTNITATEFYNQPWRVSMWDFLTIQALEGGVQFMDGEVIEDAQAVGKRLAEMIAAGKLRT